MPAPDLSTHTRAAIAFFCDQWGVVELSVFGSAVRGELRPDSDLDFLVTFEHGRSVSLLDLAEMEEELEMICGRDVEIVTRRSVESSDNEIRSRNILTSAQPIVQRSRT